MNENTIKIIGSEMSKYLNNFQMSKLNNVLYKQIDNKEFDNMSNVDFYNKFINTKRLEGVSELTIKNYRIHLNKFFNYLNKDIRTITTDDIREYLSYHQKQTNCCNVSLDNVRRLLSGFFAFLELEDYIVKNPVRRIHKIRVEKLIKETYSDELIEQLRNNCTNIRNLAIIDLLSSSGMRIGELVGLNKTDINFESNSCLVYGKGKKMREVYFDAKAKLHLKEYLKTRADNNEALFVTMDKPYDRLGVRGVEMMLKKIGYIIGAEQIYPHKFRRTLATKAIDKGMPIERVQRLLGHSKIDTTLHYAMVNQNNVRISHAKYIC